MKKVVSLILVVVFSLCISACGDPNPGGNSNSEPVQTIRVILEVECAENLLFSRYDIDVFVDSEQLGIVEHGANKIFELWLAEGKHTLTVENESDSSVDGAADFFVQQEVKYKYKASCKNDQVKLELVSEESLSTELNSESNSVEKVTDSDADNSLSNSSNTISDNISDYVSSTNAETQETQSDSSTNVDSNTDLEDNVPQYITVENDSAFANLMKITDQTDATRINNFASLYRGKIIEFDGCVVFLMKHGSYTTRFDVCLAGCDFESDRVYGPLFSFMDVSYNDMNVYGSDSVEGGMNFHIIAEIKGFDAAACCIELEPVKMIKR